MEVIIPISTSYSVIQMNLFVNEWKYDSKCLRVAICSMTLLVRCYWCTSILIIIPTIRCCSLTGPLCG